MKNTLRKHRFSNNELTQEEIAQKVGVSRQTIIAIEKGKYHPSILLALKLARALNTTVESLFQLEDSDVQDP